MAQFHMTTTIMTGGFIFLFIECCAGIYGGMRAAMQLRCFLAELGCISVSNIFGIPKVHEAIAEDGTPVDKHMEPGAEKLIAQLDWHAHAMRNHKQAVGTPK